MEQLQLDNTIRKLQKSYNFETKKLNEILKQLTPEEMEIVFNDSLVLNNLYKITDYDLLFMIFRMVPASIQEKIWEKENNQKLLLCLGHYSDEVILNKAMSSKFYHENHLEKKDKRKEFYFSKEKVSRVDLFLRSIKSDKILDSLTYNKYFQMILLCSKKLQPKILNRIDIEKLFNNTINGSIYPNVSKKAKRDWCTFLNNVSSKLLFPNDISDIYEPTTKKLDTYHREKKGTLGEMIKGKLWALKLANKKLEITLDILKQLNVFEISVLLENNDGVVDQNVLDEFLNEILAHAIMDGSILSKKYLPLNSIHETYPFRVFKIVCYKMIGSNDEQKLLDYIYPTLFSGNYTEEEKKTIYLSLKSTLVHIKKEDVYNLFVEPNDIKSIFYLRFNISARRMDYLNGMRLQQLMHVNVKHVNTLVKLLEDETQDELSDTYSKAIKMYFTFGLERSIRLLNGEYGPINKTFMDNVSKLDVSKVEMKKEGKKYIPVLNEAFIHFMFNESNNISRVFKQNSAICSSWSYLYNNIDMLLDVCKGHITALQAETILAEQINNVQYDLTPDNYRLRSILYEVGLGNKTDSSNNRVYSELVKTYEQQVQRTYSSIPYVKGVLDSGYSYETMKLDSLDAYTLGYKGNCCIRLLDIGHKHLLHALLCENGRILIVYRPDGSVASFSPLKRNGELLIANSIEAVERSNYDKIKEAFLAGINAIVDKSKEVEEKGLSVACIGTGGYVRIDGIPWPSSIPTPTILEKNHPIYKNTDEYHKSLTIIAKDEKVDLRKLKFGSVEEKYYDPRDSYEICSFKDCDDLEKIESIRAIDAIRYRRYKLEKTDEPFMQTSAYFLQYVFYTKDWYVFIDRYNKVIYDCVSEDPRAKSEMLAAASVIEEEMKKNHSDVKKLTFKSNK